MQHVRVSKQLLKCIAKSPFVFPTCWVLGDWPACVATGITTRRHNSTSLCVCVCVCVCGYIVSVDVPAATAPLGVCGYTVSVEVPATTAPLGVCVATLSVWIYPPQKHLSVCVRKP